MGTLYQRKPGGTYYGYWSDSKGRHHRQTLRTKDQRVARERLRQLELVSTDPAAHSRHTLGAAIGHLLDVVSHGNAAATWKSYRQKGENVLDGIGNVELGHLRREDVLAYIKARKAKGASDGTIHKELVVLRRALTEARTRGLWNGSARDIVPVIKVTYHPRERWLTPRQVELLLAEVPRQRQLWIGLAALAGGSLSEVERCRVEHVDIANKRLRLPGKKRSTRFRLVPIHPSLMPMLKTAIKGRAPDATLVDKWPNVRRDLHAAVERINTNVVKRKRAGAALPKVSPNDLRRTFASWLKQEGVDSMTVAHLMGHSSTRMVELVYGRLSDETYQDAVAQMPRLRKVSNR